ncbi:hypothetical protein [Roseobacter litoralis]|uniref:hypothetical protein n=1 Tax=Roseobacter litoralis TaxID=42443 RepID=UPI0024944850|nr:hypothetical protein [Roseobacter litoralis]
MALDLMKNARDAIFRYEKMQAPKRQTRFTYRDGPMVFLGQQIVKAMQDAGYPAMIAETYVSPITQNIRYVTGKSPHKAWNSPYQFLEAVSIMHPSKFKDVSDEYWETLSACVHIVSNRFNVELIAGVDSHADPSHIERRDWTHTRDDIFQKTNGEMRPPTPVELWALFLEILPTQAKAHMRSMAYEPPNVG